MTQGTEPRAQAAVPEVAALLPLEERPRCPVCDGPIAAGEGVPTRYEGMTLVFRRAECRASFERDPGRYLRAWAGEACGCPEPATDSPASEWCCDR